MRAFYLGSPCRCCSRVVRELSERAKPDDHATDGAPGGAGAQRRKARELPFSPLHDGGPHPEVGRPVGTRSRWRSAKRRIPGGFDVVVGRHARRDESASDAATGYAYASMVKTQDVLILASRLVSGDGIVLFQQVDKRKATSDGEDLLTPMVQRAAEAIADVVTKPKR